MKSLFKALTLSCLGVVMALAMVISTTSCTPGPETNTNEDYKGPIAKVLLFTNPAAPTNLYSAVSYERTATAHVFYVKTTFVRAKYIDELTNIDSRIGKDTRDFWGQFFMGLDIKSKTATAKNIAKVGVAIQTANADFEFDALFRAGSWDGSEGVKFNKADGVPFIVESHNFLINILNDGADATTDNFWSLSTEKFWMTSTDKDDTEMVGGVGTDVEFTVVDETNGDVLETNKVATDFIKYDTNSGEYMFMIPFSIVAKSDLKSVCVFGVENAGWVGSVNAVIKPLGSDVSVVYSDGENKVTGLTAVTIPTTTNEAPVITEYVPQSAYLGAISFDKGTYLATSGTPTIVVNVADPDLVGGDDFAVTITGGLTNVTVTLTETDPGSFTGTCTVGKNGTLADVVADAANTNFSISVSYTDSDPATNVSKTANVVVEIVDFEIDGLEEPMYATAFLIEDADDDSYVTNTGGTEYSDCGLDIDSVKVTNNATKLFISVKWSDTSWWDGSDGANDLVILIDDVSTATPVASDISELDGRELMTITGTTPDFFFIHGFGGWAGDGGAVLRQVVASGVDTDIEAWAQSSDKWAAAPLDSAAASYREYSFTLSDLGLASGDAVKIVAVQLKKNYYDVYNNADIAGLPAFTDPSTATGTADCSGIADYTLE